MVPEREEQPEGRWKRRRVLPGRKPPSTIVGGVLLGPSAKVVQAGDSLLEMVHEG